MLALVQRVSTAAVRVDGAVIGEIGHGLLVFFCAERDDAGAGGGADVPTASGAEADRELTRFVQRVLKLRCFADEAGRMNRSVQDVGGGLLVVPQFTLAADTASGHRPGFSAAAAPADGQRLYEAFVARLQASHPQVATGRFGADMQVSLVNDGPVTLWLRSTPGR